MYRLKHTPKQAVAATSGVRMCLARLVSGSVATIKVPELVTLLAEFADVKVVCTTAGRHFLKEEQLPEAARPILGVSYY